MKKVAPFNAPKVIPEEKIERDTLGVLDSMKVEVYHDKMRRLHAAAKIALTPLTEAVSKRFEKLADAYPGHIDDEDEDEIDDQLEETMVVIEEIELTFAEPYFPDEDYLWVQDAADLILENGHYLVSRDIVEFAYETLKNFVEAFEERYFDE